MKIDKQLYRQAFRSLKKQYFLNVVIAFIVGIILRDGYNYASDWTTDKDKEAAAYVLSENRKTNAEIITEFAEGQEIVDKDSTAAETTSQKYTMGYFSVIVNEVTASGSLGFGILNGINKIVFHGRVGESVTIFVMVVLSALMWVFIKNLIIVGRCRYFLERRSYSRVEADRILFVFHTGGIKNCAKVMLIRSVKQALWNLTIIGGVIKRYEYMLIPYILAENPTVSTKEAFALSKALMMGDKRRAFLIDVTLLPCFLVDGAAFHLTSLFFSNVYRETLFAEVYERLRAAKAGSAEGGGLLYDKLLFEPEITAFAYPDDLCPTPYLEHRKWLRTDYDKSYGGDTPILFFFFFSFIGWAWEVFFYLINDGRFINRGTLLGPWLPIYGVGGFIIIYVLRPLRKNPPLMFLGSFLVCGSVEYFTSWLLEMIMHKRWWDYTGYFANINGRVCLEGLLVFGLAGVAMTYFIAPVADNLLHKIPKRVRRDMCVILILLFAADCGWSFVHPNTGDGITEGFK